MSEHGVNSEYKISRIKFDPSKIHSIYDIFVVKTLSDMSKKICLYVDNRQNSKEINEKVNQYMNILEKFNIKKPEIIRYTDYYNIAWIYLHKLVQKNIASIEYSKDYEYNENYNMKKILESKKVKIFYKSMFNKYDSMIYNDGWYRDVFLETVIDHAEKINYVISDEANIINYDHDNNIHIIYKDFLNDLRNIFKFKEPENMLSNLLQIIKQLQIKKTHASISNLTVDQMIESNIDMDTIHKIIDTKDESIIQYSTIIESHVNNPLVVKLPNHIIYFDKTNIDISKPIFLKSFSTIQISIKDNEYIGTYIILGKKKQKKNTNKCNWYYLNDKIDIYNTRNNDKIFVSSYKKRSNTNIIIFESQIFIKNKDNYLSPMNISLT